MDACLQKCRPAAADKQECSKSIRAFIACAIAKPNSEWVCSRLAASAIPKHSVCVAELQIASACRAPLLLDPYEYLEQ